MKKNRQVATIWYVKWHTDAKMIANIAALRKKSISLQTPAVELQNQCNIQFIYLTTPKAIFQTRLSKQAW